MTAQTSRNHWKIETGWLKSSSFDALFIFGILFLAVGSGLIVWVRPELFIPVLFIDLWFLGYHHVISTFTKLAGTQADRQENKFFLYQLPWIVLGVVLCLSLTIGIWSIVTIYFFWQWYHYTRQSYGISAFYRRKVVFSETNILDHPYFQQAVIWCVPIWGVLHRCAQGWDEFLFLPVYLPAVPDWCVTLAAIASFMILSTWLVGRIYAWYCGQLALGQTLFIMSHIVAFYVGYILIDDINTGWLVANIWHNAQYILFVWLYNTYRFREPEKEITHKSDRFLAWASQPKPMRILAYFVACLAITTIFYGSIQFGFKMAIGNNVELLALVYIVIFQTVNFHHYVVDSYIWKARKPKHQKVMNLRQ